MKQIELNLPEWVFWDAHSHEGNLLGDRTIIEHVRSASVFEVFDRDFDALKGVTSSPNAYMIRKRAMEFYRGSKQSR